MKSVADSLWHMTIIHSSSDKSSGSGSILHCKQPFLYKKYYLLVAMVFKTWVTVVCAWEWYHVSSPLWNKNF